MNILVVSRWWHPRLGGGELVLMQQFSSLAKRGHKVYVVTSQWENAPEYEELEGMQIYRPHASGSSTSFLGAVFFAVRLVTFLRAFLNSHQVDIIYAGAYSCILPANLIARRYRKPMVTNVNNYFGKTWFRIVNPFLAFIYWTIPFITLHFAGQNIVCPSEAVGRELQRFSKAKVVVIPSPLDHEEILEVRNSNSENALREGLGIGRDEKLLSIVGRLSPEKNIDGLIKAMHGSHLNYRLLVVGEGPEKNKITDLIRKLGLDQKVLFLGQRSHRETMSIIKSSDVLVVPSKTEVFPTVVLEALALGRPVIATKVGGIPDIESSNLHLIDDVDEINDLLPQVHPRPDSDLLERYSFDTICSQCEAVFNELVPT